MSKLFLLCAVLCSQSVFALDYYFANATVSKDNGYKWIGTFPECTSDGKNSVISVIRIRPSTNGKNIGSLHLKFSDGTAMMVFLDSGVSEGISLSLNGKRCVREIDIRGGSMFSNGDTAKATLTGK